MPTNTLVLIELLLVFGGLLALGGWEVWKWRRWKRTQRESPDQADGSRPPTDRPR